MPRTLLKVFGGGGLESELSVQLQSLSLILDQVKQQNERFGFETFIPHMLYNIGSNLI